MPENRLSRRRILQAGLALGALGPGTRAAAAETPMIARPIPSSGEALPCIGLGTWQTFDIGSDAAERAQRRDVLELLLAGGGRVIDSSPMYGRSETVVGDLLAEMGSPSEAFLATKVWTRGKDSGIRQMEDSARKLRSKSVDLMQIHNLLDWKEHLPTLRAWKEAGKIRYLGITHYTSSALDDLADIIEREPIDFVQMAYSIKVRGAERRLLPLAADKGVAVLVNRPYEGGSLFRKVRGANLPGWAADIQADTWGQFFLKFILSHPAVTCAIPGTRKPKHLLDNLAAGRGRLPDAAERNRMVSFYEKL